ncbi:IclR family transcriptional regulator [Aldersonia sp. NBC_00410]|uniref:IclR family transcriptional regulator n=1 Tax=Aldersonia sp. NBC_00410 TaxID=2975954 RepID=UPI00225633C0|nr:IclR family transcriptional regulator [Aldersonia sp. NBC_00410]MCX5046356.1 IclR family transcriptional regulator [Aldersonia sp. NBC_00410]
MARSMSGESVLQRVVRILEVFDPENVAVSVTDIAERAGLTLSTASRLVDELVEHGLLQRDRNRRVRIGVRLWELASRAAPMRGLRDAAMPFLEDLHAIVGHHVQIGVLDGTEVLFIERLSSPGAVINLTRIAGRLSLHASSSGLVLLAHAPSEFQDQIITGPLPRYTDRTITDPRALRVFLAEIRRSGVAICPGFIHDDAMGIAVPIRDRADRVVAALSVVVPREERATVLVSILQASARGVQRELGRPMSPAEMSPAETATSQVAPIQ